jgi:hypothetical protein
LGPRVSQVRSREVRVERGGLRVQQAHLQQCMASHAGEEEGGCVGERRGMGAVLRCRLQLVALRHSHHTMD